MTYQFDKSLPNTILNTHYIYKKVEIVRLRPIYVNTKRYNDVRQVLR